MFLDSFEFKILIDSVLNKILIMLRVSKMCRNKVSNAEICNKLLGFYTYRLLCIHCVNN